jgi:hypothetical protein
MGAPTSGTNVANKNESAIYSSERHWSVAEIATAWNLSEDVIRRLFSKEPGVLVIGRRTKSTKRRYRTLRIPQSVLESVYCQMRSI